MGTHDFSQSLHSGNGSHKNPENLSEEEAPASIAIYKDEIPPFVAATLERLYENLYCTLTRIEAYDSLDKISTFVKKIGARIVTIILFREHDRAIFVVNQQIALTAKEIGSFCDAIFQARKNIHIVRFYALDTCIDNFRYPYQQVGTLEENIIQLPRNKEDYHTSLNSQFIKRLRKLAHDIKEKNSSYEVKFASRNQIEQKIVEDILALARKRMISKGAHTYTDTINVTALMKTLKKYGHVAFSVINGKVCAGSIFFSVGRRHFHQIAAHDPVYDRYELGSQIWMRAIEHSMELNGETCWMMGGASDHKAKFHAKKHIFKSIVVYRSRPHLVLSAPTFLYYWKWQKTVKVRLSFESALKSERVISRTAAKIVKKIIGRYRAVRQAKIFQRGP